MDRMEQPSRRSAMVKIACGLPILAAGTSVSVAQETGSAPTVTHALTHYRTVSVGNLAVFYREAGHPEAPVLLMLHGFPSSSRMFNSLIPLLAADYRIIAPDYPGFGHSEAPSPDQFTYTFDNIAGVMDDFTHALGVDRYSLYMQDYGGPVGFRLACAHPERVQGLIIQNAVAHEEGLGPVWEARRAFWADRAANETKLRANFLSFEATKQRHIGSSPHPDRYDPDSWTDEYAFLTRPGQDQIQSDLFYDYRTNVASYPRWQAYLRAHRPPTLVLWGKYDPSFAVAGAHAYGRDVPDAEIHILDAGHFALDEATDEIATLMRRFLQSKGIASR